jgi:hypothetical protein
VDDALRVGGVEGRGEVVDPLADGPGRRRRTGFEAGGERPSREVRHLDVGNPVLDAEPVDLEDVRVLELGRRPGLPAEPRVELRQARDRLLDDLDGDSPFQGDVDGLPDLGHPPLAQLSDEAAVPQTDPFGKRHFGGSDSPGLVGRC